MVQVFQPTKFFAQRDTSEILSINNIGLVATLADEDVSELVTLHDVIVIGVTQLDNYRVCFKCTA